MLVNYGGVVQYFVPTIRIDAYLRDSGVKVVDLVKIDVEQFEPQVLRGMGQLLAECKPSLLIEILNQRVAREVNALTCGLGYNIFEIVEGRRLRRKCDTLSKQSGERNYLLAQDIAVKRADIGDLVLP